MNLSRNLNQQNIFILHYYLVQILSQTQKPKVIDNV